MAVGEDSQVHLLEVYPQGLGIVGKGLGTAGVQQDVMLTVLDIQGQAVLRGEPAVLRGSVFYQDGYLHGDALLSFNGLGTGEVVDPFAGAQTNHAGDTFDQLLGTHG